MKPNPARSRNGCRQGTKGCVRRSRKTVPATRLAVEKTPLSGTPEGEIHGNGTFVAEILAKKTNIFLHNDLKKS